MSEPIHTSGITPAPTDEEAAAIVAAAQALWPRPSAAADQSAPEPAWRFSGRWWNRPVAQARQRPWRR